MTTTDFELTGSVPVPLDKAPDTDDYDTDLSNVIPLADKPATEEAPYGYIPTGRIRKRPKGSRARTATTGPRGSNEALAGQAAALLAQTNGLLCTGLMLTGFQNTASAIASRNDAFEAQVRSALLTDPALCRTILKAGGTSAKLSLLIAYAMLAGSVAPVAIEEYREIREARSNDE